MKTSRANLRVVGRTERQIETPPPEELLRDIVPELQAIEGTAAVLRQLLSEQGRLLAAKRGVAFIREEHLRQEFGE